MKELGATAAAVEITAETAKVITYCKTVRQ